MCTLDSVSLRVTQSALSSQLEPSAAVVSGVRMPEQQTTLHSSCDDSGLQSSVEWRQVTLVAGKATVEVTLLPNCSLSPLLFHASFCTMLLVGTVVPAMTPSRVRLSCSFCIMPQAHMCLRWHVCDKPCEHSVDVSGSVVYGFL